MIAKHTQGELIAAVTRACGNLSEAARQLGLSRATIHARLRRHPEMRDALKRVSCTTPCPTCGGTGVVHETTQSP